MAFDFRGTKIPNGATEQFSLPVAVNAGGHSVTIPVHAIAGASDGPVILVTAGSHGEEVWSTELLRRIHAHFVARRNELHGMLLLAPVLSPISFEAGIRHTPYDYHNLNRVFPGAGPGAGWFTEMIANVIAVDLLPTADILIDYHGGGSDTIIEYQYTVPPSAPNYDLIHNAALAGGAPVLWEVNETRGTLTKQFTESGKPAIVPEVGGGGALHVDGYFERAITGFANMLHVFGALDGEASHPQANPLFVREGRAVRPRHGGVFLPSIGIEALGTEVAGGTLLGRVVSPYTFEVLDELSAPYPKTAIMQVRNRLSVVQPGDYAYIVGNIDSGLHQ